MIKRQLIRFLECDSGTYGVLCYITEKGDSYPVFPTLELPWRHNQENISCIPPGVYRCTKWVSPTKGYVAKLHDVPERSNVLIHVGNTRINTTGCILIGTKFGNLEDLHGILASAAALRNFLDDHKEIDEWELEVIDKTGRIV